MLDKLSEGAEKVAKEAEKVFEQAKTKVEELQLERQMDAAARKLGYLEFDASRGRVPDRAKKEELLGELIRVEEQLSEMRAAREAASVAGTDRTQAGGEMAEVRRVEEAAQAAQMATQPTSGASAGADMAEAARIQEAAAAAEVSTAVPSEPAATGETDRTE